MADIAESTASSVGEPRGPYDTLSYVTASARHTGTEPYLLTADRAALWLLKGPDGSLRTVYGYPQPLGDSADESLSALANELVALAVPRRIALSPLGPGGRLADLLRGRLPIVQKRDVWIADLSADPVGAFSAGARSMVRRAVRGGARSTVTHLLPDFGDLYRRAMDEINADAVYRFEEAYFRALTTPDAFQVTVTDTSGICASAMFLCRGAESSYHLSARRVRPAAVPGGANLAVADGLRECGHRGARHCILGGGLSTEADDPLYKFKAGMASVALERPMFGAPADG